MSLETTDRWFRLCVGRYTKMDMVSASCTCGARARVVNMKTYIY